METNGITVPDGGTSRQYIADPIGGWLYIVTTIVAVQQQNLSTFQKQLEDAKEQLQKAQALVDELAPHAQDLASAIAANANTPVT